jgi:hypothetical protein
MILYTVHFQKGTRINTRKLRLIAIKADTADEAKARARSQLRDCGNITGYRITRVTEIKR